jgi:long-chain acyl-CoA synthetase
MGFWTTVNIQQILFHFIKKLSNDSFGFYHINEHKPIEFSNDLGLSSIQVMELAAYTNSFFHLFDIPEPPALLRIPTLQGWAEAVFKARNQLNDFVTFKTSGTSGESKLITHSVEALIAEIHYLQTILPKPTQIISLVPSNHIYGFLFSVILPAVWSVPVVYTNSLTKTQLNSNSLIIGTPFNWHYLHASLNQQPVHCWGISASAPLNNDLYRSLTRQGFQITEIYGSTETAGVGYRQSAEQAFSLFDYWNFKVAQNNIIHQVTGKELSLIHI